MRAPRGILFDIQRFCVDDGPGIRTTVFFKGCPLGCIWCHNPESKSFQPELLYDGLKCAHCGACGKVCPQSCHTFTGGKHTFDRACCMLCGRCAGVCMFGALRIAGEEMTAEEVLDRIRADQPFYDESGGGVTLSGGEPLSQFDFALAVLEKAKTAGLHTCVETSGYIRSDLIVKAARYTDIFLYDIKHMDRDTHLKLTNVDNDLILDNLKTLDAQGSKTILCLPIIPGCNDDDGHFAKVGKLANTMKYVMRLEIMPYHPLGIAKAAMLGKSPEYTSEELPDSGQKQRWLSGIKAHTDLEVRCR